MADNTIPFADNNIVMPSDSNPPLAQPVSQTDVNQAAVQTPQSILASAQPQIAIQPVAVPVAPAPIDTSSKASLLKGLVTGLLSGAAGGVTAPFGSSAGGQLGLANYERVQQQEVQQQQRDQQAKQQQFQDQLAANQDQRATLLNQAQIAHSNLQMLDLAHTIGNLPLEDQVKFAQAQNTMADLYKDSGYNVVALPGTKDAVTQYFKANPNLNVGNTQFIHVHNPDGEDAVLAVSGNPKKQFTGADLKKVAPDRFKSIPDDATITPEQFFQTATNALNTQATQDFQRQQTQYVQQQENRRQASQNATTLAAARLRTEAQSGGDQVSQLVQKVLDGDVTPDQLNGMGAKLKGAVLANLPRGTDATALSTEFKVSQQPQTTNTISAIGTLLGTKDSEGLLPKFQKAMKEANISNISDLNSFVNDLAVRAGTEHGKKVKEARGIALALEDQYARLIGAGTPTDTSRAEAKANFDPNASSKPTQGAVQAALDELSSRLGTLSAQSRYTKKNIINTLSPEGIQFLNNAKPQSQQQNSSPIATDAKGNKVQWNGSAWVPVQ